MSATVLQLSDIHLTAAVGGPVHGIDPDARLATVLAAWADTGEMADLVLVTGDDADDGSPAAYQRLAAALDSIGAPMLVIPGNHDDPAAVRAAFAAPTVAEVGGWRLAGFDSVVPGEIHGAIDAGSVTDVLDGLDDRPTVVAIHHPPRSPSTHPWARLDGSEQLLDDLAQRPHVRAVVSGHLHQPFELEGAGGLQLLGAPSTNEPIDHHGDTFTAPGTCPTGARVLRLGDDGMLSSAILPA